MSQFRRYINQSSNEDFELDDIKQWSSESNVSEQDVGSEQKSSKMEDDQAVSMDLKDPHDSHSLESDDSKNGWKRWIRRPLMNKGASPDISFSRALLLVGLSIFFVLTTSLLVTGFQGLLPSLLEDGVRFMFILLTISQS